MKSATIIWISGPLMRARAETDAAFALYEAVRVGEEGLLGEVIRLDRDEVTIQVYEDTTGLAPGMPVIGTAQPLSVPLGPGMLGGIFDGLLRPLSHLDADFLPRGLKPDRHDRFRFEPLVAVGDTVLGGHPFARVRNDGVTTQSLQVPPALSGRVVELIEPGEYAEETPVMTLEGDDGTRHRLTMIQSWPVRSPRPVKRRQTVSRPLITGQRILDSLFPIGLGSRAAVPGGFGTGKTVLLEALAKGAAADIIVFVGCGERGNELTGMLEEFPELTDPRTGGPLMARTVIIANTSNMSVAAREASIYTGVTVAEYFRDQGLDVALMADSTSRWAEALRELSGRLGELPGEGGYPAYLSSRLADFYERSGGATTLCESQGSVTIVGTVSPPSGDFSEPVVTHTKRYVKSFWALDTKRAQARIYPAIDPLQSYAEEAEVLNTWWQANGNSQWLVLRRKVLTLLEEQVRLERMARIIGKDALAHGQQMRLFSGELITNAFLRQSAFSEIDRYCSPRKQIAMIRLLGLYIDRADRAIDQGVTPKQIIELPITRRLTRMGEDIPEDRIQELEQLEAELDNAFAELTQSQTDPQASA